MFTDTEWLESNREWREALPPTVIELCAVCMQEQSACECAVQAGRIVRNRDDVIGDGRD